MDDQRSLFAQEYQMLQKHYEDVGARALSVKAWSVTFSATGLGLAFTAQEPALLLVSSLSAFVFWTLEATTKMYQRSFRERLDALEKHFASASIEANPFQIYASRLKQKSDFMRWLEELKRFHVMVPHVVVVAAGIGLYALQVVGDKAQPEIVLRVPI